MCRQQFSVERLVQITVQSREAVGTLAATKSTFMGAYKYIHVATCRVPGQCAHYSDCSPLQYKQLSGYTTQPDLAAAVSHTLSSLTIVTPATSSSTSQTVFPLSLSLFPSGNNRLAATGRESQLTPLQCTDTFRHGQVSRPIVRLQLRSLIFEPEQLIAIHIRQKDAEAAKLD